VRNTLGHQKLRGHLATLRARGETQATLAESLTAVVHRRIKQGSVSRWAHGATPGGDIIAALSELGIAESRDWLIQVAAESGPLPLTESSSNTGTDD
jgi:hypothetical protein